MNDDDEHVRHFSQVRPDVFVKKIDCHIKEYIGGLKCCGDTPLTFHSLKKAYNVENMRLGKTGAGMTYEDLQRDPSKVNLISMFSIPHLSFADANA